MIRFPKKCPICKLSLKEDNSLVTSPGIEFTCSNFGSRHFYYISDKGNNIDEYQIQFKINEKEYFLHTGTEHPNKNIMHPAFYEIFRRNEYKRIIEDKKFIPFTKRKQFIKRIEKILAFL